jgi:PAS domain S-box-containing protein
MPQSIERIDNFQNIIELAPIGALVHDLRYIRYMNRFMLNLLGYADQAEIIGTPVLEIVHPDFRDYIAGRISRIEQKLEITEPQEIKMLRRDGDAVYVTASGFPVIYGGQEAVQVIFQDITERKKTEREALQQKRDMEQTLEKTQGIVWRADPVTFHFEFVSKQAETILGYPVERWLNEETFWVDHIHADDRQWTYDFCVAQTKAMVYHEFEYRMIAADGRIVWLRDSVSVEAANGVPVTLYGLMTDITVMKKLEYGLLESEARYRLIAENSTDIISQVTPAGKVTYVSPAVERILGFSVRKILERDSLELVHPDDTPYLQKVFNDFVPGEGNTKFEYRCRTASGDFVWLESVMTTITAANSSDWQYLITSRDVTARKRAEIQLQKSHDLLHKISMQVPGIIFQLRMDPSGKMIFPYISESMRQLGELDPEDKGANFEIITSRIHPADRDLYLAAIKKSAENMSRVSVEYRIMLPKMGMRWRLAEAQPERESDGSILWHGYANDITDRKLMQDALFESEARLRTMAEHSPIGIFMVNPEGDNIFASNWFCNKLGVQVHELLGRDWLKFVHPEDASARNQVWMDFWEKDWPYDVEYRVFTRDGKLFHFHAKAEKLHKGSQMIGAVGIVEDITEKKAAEKQIRDLSGKLIDVAERERSEISRELHDSVGQNLVILKLRLQRRMEMLPEEQKQIIGDFFEPIDNVMTTTREISRKLSPMHLQTLGLCLAIEDLCDHIRKTKPYQIDLSLTGIDEVFSAEMHIQVYRIVQEAITNILKHSDATQILIRFEVGAVSKTLTISDNGTFKTNTGEMNNGIGIQIMRERARVLGGELKFTRSQFGAEVSLEING